MESNPHSHDEVPQPAPRLETPVDSGSQALSEALGSSFTIVKWAMVLLVLVFCFSGVFTVGPQERAIKLHFGKAVGQGEDALLKPGPHFSWPYPIDEHIKVSISGLQQARSTVGWYATTPEQELAGTEPPAGPSLNPAVDGYVLTSDNNIVHSRVTLSYRISDPVSYVFAFVNASNSVQNALDNALIAAAAHYGVDDILYRDVLGFREEVRHRVAELIRKQDLGITIEQCSVDSVRPRQTKDAFENVLKAEVDRSKVLNDARSYANQVLSKAGADAASRTNLAMSERNRLVNEVASRADEFQKLLPKYQEAPQLFVAKRRTEVFGRVFTNVQDKIFLVENADGRAKELRLLLNREIPKKQEAAR
jgi:membrane protease subunit HflK